MQGSYPPGVLERLQAAEREMLVAIDELCRAEGIDYFIEAGTLLGAMRHGGFIPWDDDIDVSMPYPDWLRFIQVANDKLPVGMSLHTPLDTPNMPMLWGKVFLDGTRFVDEIAAEAGMAQGIFIDVFPYCRLDADLVTAVRQQREARRIQSLCYLHYLAHPKVPRDTSLRALKVAGCVAAHLTVARPFGARRCMDALARVSLTENPSGDWFMPCYPDWRYPGSLMFPTQDIAFDGLTLRAPAKPDEMLRIYYGDYTQLPPEEDRYTHLPLQLDFGDGAGNVMEQA